MAEPARKIDRGPDDFSEAEEAYFTTGGDTGKLEAEGFKPEAPQEPAAKPAEPEKPAAAEKPAEQQAAGDKAAEPDPDAEPDDSEFDAQTGKPKTRGKWVSKKALDAERSARKKEREDWDRERQDNAKVRENWARLEERFKVFQEALAVQEPTAEQQQPEEDELPDPEKDIFAFLKALPNALDRRIDRRFSPLEQRVGQVSETTEAQRAETQMLASYQSDARRFIETQPDFLHAYAFLVKQRDAELAAAGYANPQERMRYIVADERDLVNGALKANVSPSERMYAMAKARGYVKAEATSPAQNGNGHAQPTAEVKPAEAAKPTAAEEIARLKAGQDAALSLSNAGGNRAPTITIEDLVNMPDDEFRAFARKNPGLYEQMLGKGG